LSNFLPAFDVTVDKRWGACCSVYGLKKIRSQMDMATGSTQISNIRVLQTLNRTWYALIHSLDFVLGVYKNRLPWVHVEKT